MPPKDWIVYIDEKNNTRAAIDNHTGTEVDIIEEGYKIIGFVSSGSEAEAVAYGDQVLR